MYFSCFGPFWVWGVTIPIPFLSTSSYVNIIHFYIYEVPFIYFVSLLYRFKFLALYCYDCVYLSLSSFMLIFICCWLWCCYVPRWVLNHLDLTWVVPLGGRNLISSRHLGTFYVLVHIMSSLLFNAIPPSPLLLLSSILFNVSPPLL